jgi:tetratricopeptide (TPR) repeat protein
MKMSQEEFERIEKYLEGTLEGAPLVQFEKRLIEDAVLAANVEEQRILSNAIKEQNLRTRLDGFHDMLSENKEDSSNKVINLNTYLRYAVAACVAFLLLWGGFRYFNGTGSNQEQNEQLFATHFIPDPGLPTTMSASDNYEFFNAMVSYKQGDYQKAIEVWETLIKEKPRNDTLNYFIGVAHLANNNEGEAISYLQWAAEYPESVFSKEVYHYLGLAHLKNGDKETAATALEKSELKRSEELLKKLSD